jgi:hypothetical protein
MLVYIACHLVSFNSFQRKMSEPQDDHQKLRAKVGAKPFDTQQQHWTQIDKIFTIPALQLHAATSQEV